MMLIESAIGAIIEMTIDAAWDRSKRREAVIRMLRKLKLDPNNPPDDFESLYVYTLVEYGAFKPKPILNFFRNEFVREAFQKAFYENDPSILEDEAEGIIQWNEETGQLGRIDYDPRREFAAFSVVFNELVDYSRTPAEARRDHKLDAIVEKLDQLKDLDQIRAELARIVKTQQEQQPAATSWPGLLAGCQRQVEHAVRAIGQKYVPELYVEREQVEAEFASFLESKQSCFIVVGRSGKGKTNLLCHLAHSYSSHLPVLLLSGRRRIQDESALIAQIARDLPYLSPIEAPGHHPRIEGLLDMLRERDTIGIILIDGISENEDIVLMKQAVSELLTRYGESEWLKIGLTCRDTLWYRFSNAIPSHLLYHRTSMIGEFRQAPVSTSLGSWTDDEFRRAVAKYKQHFDIEFSLAPDVVRRSKYPLVLRLLCEAYSGETLGVIDYLPTNKVFHDYLDRKTHKVADYFGLDINPHDVFARLVDIRAALWDEQKARSIPRSQVLDILSGLNPETAVAVYTRLVDEGILFESESDSLTEPFAGFLFDEVGDYLLYRHLMTRLSDDEHVTPGLVDRLSSSVHSESLEKTASSERLLELIARNLEDVGLQEYLLEQVLKQDLHLFARCADQRLVVPSAADGPQERAEQFADRLLRWYERIAERYFPELRDRFDPHLSPESSDRRLGIDLYASAEFREVAYYYRRRDKSEERVKAKLTEGYPTFHLSWVSEGLREFKLHDPDSGRFVSIWRGFDGVRRTLNFEYDLPFPGVSLDVPGRVAKYDIWNELSHVIEKHWLREPSPLLHERTVSLIKELEREGIDVTTAQSIEECRESVLSHLAENSRQYAEMSTKLEVLHNNLCVLDDSYDLSWLPQPDPDEDSSENVEAQWQRYSDDLMREYLSVLFSTFAGCYRLLVRENFPSISHRMNLYQQWPVLILVVVSPLRDQVRILAAPQSNEDEANIQINLLPADSSPDIANGHIVTDRGLSLAEHVEETLRSTGRMTTSSHLVDILLSTEHLFNENPLNYLTYNWLKSELAEVLQIAFQFGR